MYGESSQICLQYNKSKNTSKLITNFTHVWNSKLLMIDNKEALIISLYKNQ